MPNARTGRYAAEPRVGDQRYVPAKGQVTKSTGKLERFFHSGTHRPATGEHDDVAGRNLPRLDRLNRARLARKHFCGSGYAVNPVSSYNGRIDRGALDDRTLGREVPARETDSGGHSTQLGCIRAENDIIWI